MNDALQELSYINSSLYLPNPPSFKTTKRSQTVYSHLQNDIAKEGAGTEFTPGLDD